MNKKKIVRNTDKPIQKVRFIFQTAFALLCIWIGVEFYFFVEYLETGGQSGSFYRPACVEGFLPISSLMNLYYFILTGNIHNAHPAGLFIFIAIVTVSFAFGKSFCSWLCPVGFLSELVGDFGEKITGKKLKLPKLLDYPLRSLKYIILFFFVYSIVFMMSSLALKIFLDSPYNIISDVKMYLFFAEISRFSLIVIAVLFVLSIFLRNFWCRYLCPYGALLGMFSLISPTKIKRNETSCIDCSLCAKACPSFIKVDKAKTVLSDECTSCFNCIDACPVKDTLYLETVKPKFRISKKMAAIGIAVLYFIIIGIGIVTGNWQNEISEEEYLIYYNQRKSINHFEEGTGLESFNRQIKPGK